jgi:hypothetical protein
MASFTTRVYTHAMEASEAKARQALNRVFVGSGENVVRLQLAASQLDGPTHDRAPVHISFTQGLCRDCFPRSEA